MAGTAIALLVALAAPPIAETARKYSKLKRVGVSASGASLNGNELRVIVQTKRRVTVELAVVRNRKTVLQGFAPIKLNRGAYRITRVLTDDLKGSNLGLRVTVKRAGRYARGVIRLRIVKATGPAVEAPVRRRPPPPPPPAPPPPPPPREPSLITLSPPSWVQENTPAGQVVGTLAATDPDRGDAHTFTLVPGTGDTNNGYFKITGNTVTSTTPVNFELTPELNMRVRATDRHGLSLELWIIVAVIDVDEPTQFTPSPGATIHPSTAAVGTVIDPLLILADPDEAAWTGLTVSVSAGFQVGETLGWTQTNAPLFPGTFNALTGVLTFSGEALTGEVLNLMRSLTFKSTTVGSNTIRFVLTPGAPPAGPTLAVPARTKQVTVT